VRRTLRLQPTFERGCEPRTITASALAVLTAVAGANTLRYKQSSLTVVLYTLGSCMHMLLCRVAFSGSLHGVGGTDSRHRSRPRGGAANGMRRNASVPLPCGSPTTGPYVVFTMALPAAVATSSAAAAAATANMVREFSTSKSVVLHADVAPSSHAMQRSSILALLGVVSV
jgi:hypothetical protein